MRFDPDTKDNTAADDSGEDDDHLDYMMDQLNRGHDYGPRMTYGGTDAMFQERVDTVYKKKVLTEEQKMAQLLGPAYAIKKKAEENVRKR